MNVVELDGKKINYVKVGQGKQNVFCLPGALGTIQSDFGPQLNEKNGLNREKFTIICYDPPGYGGSRPPNKIFNMNFYDEESNIATKFLEKIGINKYSLLGWSDGGITALIMAINNPSKCDKLAIWGANSFVNQTDIDAYEKIRDLNKWSDKMKKPLIEMYGEKGLQDMWCGWCDALIEIFNKRNGVIIPENNLKSIKCPTFILHGDKDPLVGLFHPEFLLNKIPNSKIYRFADGKHNINLRYAEEFNKLISEFLLN